MASVALVRTAIRLYDSTESYLTSAYLWRCECTHINREKREPKCSQRTAKIQILSKMKLFSLSTFVLLLSPVAGSVFKATNVAFIKPESHHVATLRAGSLEASSDSLALASTVLLHLFGGVNAFHGMILAAFPNVGTQLLGTSGADDPDAAYAEEAIGAFALEYGLTGFLAASGRVAADKAIGYGTLPDLLFLTKNLANGTFQKFGVQGLMTGMTVLAGSCTAAILTDKLHLGPILEILTIVPAIQGSVKYFDPVGAAKKMMGTDLSNKRTFLYAVVVVGPPFLRHTQAFFVND